jgi:hypothetical protein
MRHLMLYLNKGESKTCTYKKTACGKKEEEVGELPRATPQAAEGAF